MKMLQIMSDLCDDAADSLVAYSNYAGANILLGH